MLYAIVEFVSTGTEEIDFLPLKWISDGTQEKDIVKHIKSRQLVEFYWPPMKSTSSVSKAKDLCTPAEVGWPKYKARILGTARE
jgi:hypothetical protein